VVTTTLSPKLVDIWASYIDDPVAFVIEILCEQPTPYQAAVLRALAAHRRVAWRKGHKVGGTKTEVWAALWYFATRPDSRVVDTAPTYDRQVKRVFWPEMHRTARKSGLAPHLEILETQIYSVGRQGGFITGESSDAPDNMQGFHSARSGVLFIVDEGSGVDDAIYEAIEGSMASAESRILVVGNPLRTEGKFYRIFTSEADMWQCFHTSSKDSPFVSSEWLDEMEREYGDGSPQYAARVLGEFPEETEDTLLRLAWIEVATTAKVETEEIYSLGVDVARSEKGDMTALVLLRGGKVQSAEEHQGWPVTATTGRVVAIRENIPSVKVAVDDTGVGGGVTDMLREKGVDVLAVNFGAAADDANRFFNKAAEMYWRLRGAFQEGSIAIPADHRLMAQLSQIKYETTYLSSGRDRIKVDKFGLTASERRQGRKGRSPDLADALALAFEARAKGQRRWILA